MNKLSYFKLLLILVFMNAGYTQAQTQVNISTPQTSGNFKAGQLVKASPGAQLKPSSASTPIRLYIDLNLNSVASPHLAATDQVYTLRRKLDAGYCITRDNYICFKYDEEYSDTDSKLEYTIYNKSQQIIYSSQQNNAAQSPGMIPVSAGDNRFKLNLAPCSPAILAGEYYVLEIINEKKEKFYLRFTYIQPGID